MTDTLLKVHGLRVGYGPVVAVHHFDLEVARGEIVALVGSNGAGKTSTVSAISGLVKPLAGEIWFDGKDITGQQPERIVARGLGMVPEGRHILGSLTVEENLRLGAASRSDNAAIRRDIALAQERFPILGERRKQAAGLLSGGEQQQLALARAMMARPQLLLLDEPSLGLAPLVIDAVFDTITQLRDEGVTILLIEQNANRAIELADRSLVMRTGRVVATGTRAEVAAGLDLSIEYLGIGGAG